MWRSPRFVWEGRELWSSALVRRVPSPSNIPTHSCSHGDFPVFSIEKLITNLFHFIYYIHVHFVVSQRKKFSRLNCQDITNQTNQILNYDFSLYHVPVIKIRTSIHSPVFKPLCIKNCGADGISNSKYDCNFSKHKLSWILTCTCSYTYLLIILIVFRLSNRVFFSRRIE